MVFKFDQIYYILNYTLFAICPDYLARAMTARDASNAEPPTAICDMGKDFVDDLNHL